MRLIRYLLLLAMLLGVAPPSAQAQTEPPPTPPVAGELPPIPRVHVVQQGESLAGIAASYGISVEALLQANNIADPSLLAVGQELAVPGVQGDPVLTAHVLEVGDTLLRLAAAYNTTIQAIARSSRLLHPTHLVAGETITFTSRTGTAAPMPFTGAAHVVQPGETPLMLAAAYNLSLTTLARLNHLALPLRLYPGQRLRLPGEAPYQFLPEEWLSVRVHPAAPTQGQTVSVYVEHADRGLPAGTAASQSLRFVPWGAGYVALFGLDAFAEPGRYSLELGGSGSRPWRSFQQDFTLHPADYGLQQITVGPELAPLLDPAVRAREDEFLAPYYSQFSDTPRWDGLFQYPGTSHQVTAGYGASRSYNGGPIQVFHTGVDFAVPTGSPVWSPAPGVVVFAQATELRGNVLILDHGLGVMTGFFHLNTFLVNVGDPIALGQLVAESGSTGLSNGPHLHWDLRIHNVPVNALQWVEQQFP